MLRDAQIIGCADMPQCADMPLLPLLLTNSTSCLTCIFVRGGSIVAPLTGVSCDENNENAQKPSPSEAIIFGNILIDKRQ